MQQHARRLSDAQKQTASLVYLYFMAALTLVAAVFLFLPRVVTVG